MKTFQHLIIGEIETIQIFGLTIYIRVSEKCRGFGFINWKRINAISSPS